jgi:hypothetical protein
MMRVIPQKLTNGTDTTDTTSYSACAVCNSGFVCWLTSTVDGNPSWDLFRPSVTVWETLEELKEVLNEPDDIMGATYYDPDMETARIVRLDFAEITTVKEVP